MVAGKCDPNFVAADWKVAAEFLNNYKGAVRPPHLAASCCFCLALPAGAKP